MQLKLTTNYAIRIILELARHKKRTSLELATILSVEIDFLLKILNKLKHEGFLCVRHGVSGGYMLNKNPEQLTILDIIKAMEPTIKINRCLDDEMNTRHSFVNDPIEGVYLQLQKRIEEEFSSYTIAQLVTFMRVEHDERN